MNAGITSSDAALNAHELVKTHKADWVMYKIEGTEVVPCAQYPEQARAGKGTDDADAFKDKEYQALFDALAEAEGARYVTVDFRYKTRDGRSTDKLVFLYWCKEGTKIRERMVSASTYQSFSAKLDVAKKVQATELGEIEYDAVLENVIA